MRAHLFVAGLFCASVALAQPQPQSQPQHQPEAASGVAPKQAVIGERFMVVAANPIAVDAGYEMLKRGGSAVDAAIAVQLVLNLVEPQSSGIGGGGFIVHYSAADQRVRTYDVRETAPAAAKGDRFVGLFKRPKGFIEAVLSGRSVGVPGLLRGLELAHRNHGKLEWQTLFEPALRVAEQGFPVSPRLHALLEWDRYLIRDPAARAYFYQKDGRAKPVGTMLRNPELAAVLREVANKGVDAFYSGKIARDVAEAVLNHPIEKGDLTVADLAAYRAKEREAVCGSFRTYRVCGMPPPSAGGIAVLQMLGIIEHLPPTDFERDPLRAVHMFSEAGRLAYADRDRYVADPDFVRVPVAGLLDKGYLAERATLVRTDRSLRHAAPGKPRGAEQLSYADGRVLELPSTTQVSIVDAQGNAVSMTTSIEFAFGNHRMVRGFLLNNELTDFAVHAEEEGRPVANRVQGGKRPRSSMAPMLVFDADGKLVMVTGSPGGHAIINYVAKTLVAALDWKMASQAIVDLPNFGSRNGPTELEQGTAVVKLRDGLKALGHDTRVHDMTSGVHAIMRSERGWIGVADPRREGIARGE